MADQTETEILDGTRSWNDAQAIFAGVPDPARTRYRVDCGWYDTIVEEHDGSFCMIKDGSALEELVGDFVQVDYGVRSIWVYCIGGSLDLPADLALQRTAFIRLASLQLETITVIARPTTR